MFPVQKRQLSFSSLFIKKKKKKKNVPNAVRRFSCLSPFYHFFDVFQVPISIRIDTLRVQLILQFSTHHF